MNVKPLEELYSDAKESFKKLAISWIKVPETNNNTANGLSYDQQTFAEYAYFHQGNLKKAKQAYYSGARLMRFVYNNYRNDTYPHADIAFRIDRINMALLSDHPQIITGLGHAVTNRLTQQAARGATNFTILAIIREDVEVLSEQIKLLTKYHLSKKNRNWIQPEVNFFSAYLAKDQQGITDAIYSMLKSRKYMYISKAFMRGERRMDIPAITYAKLAWLKGYEIEIDHPMIPMDFLPIQPLDHYTDELPFLKE